MSRRAWFVALLVLLVLVFGFVIVEAQGPRPGTRAPGAAVGAGFTYQGQLKNNGAVVNGTCDLAFRLYDDASVGNQIGSPITQTIVITNGLFTTQLNASNEFGANAFNGEARWLDIRVSTTCPSSGSFTPLTTRQAITPAPYALTAMKTAYKNVLVVAKSGGHYNTISAALTSITDNDATKRYLIWVAPGTYSETVTMKEYVDIEGAGEIATKITYTGSGSSSTGTVVGANNAELRFLTVENTGGNTYATAIYNNSASPRLTHITANALGGGINIGVYNDSSSSTMTHVTATASGGMGHNIGVNNNSSSPAMTNVIAMASGGGLNNGVYNASSSPTMTHVIVMASGGTDNRGVENSSSSPTMMHVTATASGGEDSRGVFNNSSSPTMTNVTATASGGSQSYGVYNSFSSPTMTNVTATGSGGTNNHGVHNSSLSSPTMTNVTATGSGGTDSRGVYNSSLSSPTMTNVTATGSGGTDSRGVYNYASSSTIQNSTISASGGTNNYGIFNTAPGGITFTVQVNNSQITGSTNTISNDNEFTTRIGASKLDGGAVTGAGVKTCAGVYDENYTFYASTCP